MVVVVVSFYWLLVEFLLVLALLVLAAPLVGTGLLATLTRPLIPSVANTRAAVITENQAEKFESFLSLLSKSEWTILVCLCDPVTLNMGRLCQFKSIQTLHLSSFCDGVVNNDR